MKKKLFSGIITISLFSLLFNQLALAAQIGDSPISSAISAPIPTPISLPISSPVLTPTPSASPSATPTPISAPIPAPYPAQPVTYHTLSGQVTYVSFGLNIFGWNYKGASNVLVETWNIQDGKYFATRTDVNGFYQLRVADGFYKIKISDNLGSNFINPIGLVFINRNISSYNFIGFRKEPVKQYSVSGQVNYFKYTYIKGKISYQYVPASGVTVEIWNRSTGEHLKAITNSKGGFNFMIGQGISIINVQKDARGTLFGPYFQPMYISQDTSGLIFNGYNPTIR